MPRASMIVDTLQLFSLNARARQSICVVIAALRRRLTGEHKPPLENQEGSAAAL
jgi:hypothetical protein